MRRAGAFASVAAAGWAIAGSLLCGLATTTPAMAQDDSGGESLQTAIARAEQALAMGEAQIAESALRDALLEGWLEIGRLHLANHRFDDAKDAYIRASRAAVETRRARRGMALAMVQLGEVDAAIDLLRQLLARAPADGNARRLLSQSLVSQGRTHEAVQELEEGVAAAPEDLETAFALATGYLRLDRVDQAAALFDRLATERPAAETQLLIGRTWRDFEHYAPARRALDKALAMDPKIRRGRYYLGTVELLKGGGTSNAGVAVELFEEELELHPDDSMTLLYLGMARVKMRQFERALAPLDAADEWPPARLDAAIHLGTAYSGLDRHADAIAAFERAALLGGDRGLDNRQMSSIHYQLGRALMADGRRTDADHHFDNAKRLGVERAELERDLYQSFVEDDLAAAAQDEILLASDDPPGGSDQSAARIDLLRTEMARVSMNLGVLQARAGRFARAADLFADATEADAELPGLQRALGLSRWRAGRYAEAVTPLERGLKAQPRDAEISEALALAYVEVGEFHKALELLDRLPSLSPGLTFARATALVRLGRVEDAAPLFEHLLERGDQFPGVHVLVGQAHAENDDFGLAEKSLRRALELQPDVAEARSTLGVIHLRRGELPAAEAMLRQELVDRPGDLRARYHLATVLDLDRRPELAIDELHQVLAARPGYAEARYLLGKILLAQGSPALAVEQLEAAARLAPDDANVQYQLGLSYQRGGDAERARQTFERYRQLKDSTRSGS